MILTELLIETECQHLDYHEDAIYCYTHGDYSNFAMTNSTIMSSMTIKLNSLNTSYKSLIINPARKLRHVINIYFFSLILVGTQVVCQVRGFCVLSFDEKRGSENSSLQINGTESFEFQCCITNSQFYTAMTRIQCLIFTASNNWYNDDLGNVYLSNTHFTSKFDNKNIIIIFAVL